MVNSNFRRETPKKAPTKKWVIRSKKVCSKSNQRDRAHLLKHLPSWVTEKIMRFRLIPDLQRLRKEKKRRSRVP
jgi:hypothetical protein